MDQGRIAAAKILIDKGKPNLQAVEQTNVNELDSMGEDELISTVRALLLSRPEVLAQLGFAPILTAVDAPNEAKSA
jgi:hypothetical protein